LTLASFLGDLVSLQQLGKGHAQVRELLDWLYLETSLIVCLVSSIESSRFKSVSFFRPQLLHVVGSCLLRIISWLVISGKIIFDGFVDDMVLITLEADVSLVRLNG